MEYLLSDDDWRRRLSVVVLHKGVMSEAIIVLLNNINKVWIRPSIFNKSQKCELTYHRLLSYLDRNKCIWLSWHWNIHHLSHIRIYEGPSFAQSIVACKSLHNEL